MIDLLEEDAPQRKSREECLSEMPEELRVQMRDMLASPNLLCWLINAIEASGVTGEHVLALTVYMIGVSRLLKKPLAAIVQGPSASGKSYVLDQVGKLFPPEEVLFATDISPQALYYGPKGNLVHRFIVAGERTRRPQDEAAETTKALRELIASGELSKIVTVSGLDGPQTIEVYQQGPIAYVESTTAPELFEEDANRCLILHPDERAEQTRRILEARGRHLAGEVTADQREAIRQQMHCLQRLLERRTVVIPYARELFQQLPDQPIEVRRVGDQIASMVQASALLFQHQRPQDDQGSVIAQPEDYWLTRKLLGDVFARTLGGKAPAALYRFVEQLKRLSGEFTTQQIAVALKMSPRTAREHLHALHVREVIEQTQAPRGQIPARWLITSAVALGDEATNSLPSIRDVCGIDEASWSWPELPANWGLADSSEVPF